MLAHTLDDLRVPPGNRLEKLTGDRVGTYSIRTPAPPHIVPEAKRQWEVRVDDRWRICFAWRDGGAWQVEIVDYH